IWRPMCAAREKRRAERIVDGGTPTWRHIWSQLKASGWTHKKPPASSIETRWKFIPPGGKANGIEGKDYVLGEDRVCAHYASEDRGGIFSSEDEDDEYELVPRDRVVRSSPTVHTSMETSLFGSSDEDDSDDEVAIDEGEVVIVDDDNGDSDYEDADSLMCSDVEDKFNKMEDGEDPCDFDDLDSGDEIDEEAIIDVDYLQDEGYEVGVEHGE
ncbi:hypothetical protein GN958_ATG02286, partial [Phytophthora infestans]